MLKYLLGAIIAIGSLSFNANASVEQCSFSSDQTKVLKYAFERGKPYNLEWTLAAIAWQESSAGLKTKNPKSDSYGLFGSLLKTVESRLKKDEEFRESLRKIPLSRKQTIFLLRNDWEFSTSFAIAELSYWKERHNGNYRKTLGSYFGGNNPNSKAAVNYVNGITKKIQYLKKSGCL